MPEVTDAMLHRAQIETVAICIHHALHAMDSTVKELERVRAVLGDMLEALENDGLGAADGHGHAGDKDDEDQQEFVHGSGIGREHPSRTGALDLFGGDG